MTNLEIADRIQHKLFADRPTLQEAWDNAFDVINRLDPSERLMVTTAMMILLNTISNQIKENENG